MSLVRCPIDGCEYWVSWGGYLDLMLRSFKKHVVKDHQELTGFDTRSQGGIIDTSFGDAIAKVFSKETP